MDDLLATNEPVVFSSEIAEEVEDVAEYTESSESDPADSTENAQSDQEEIIFPVDMLTNETYLSGVDSLVNVIDPLSVNGEVYYMDSPALYALDNMELPDYAVCYQVQGVDVIFPSSYADDILVVDGLLVNLGDSYIAGAKIDGYAVGNYLSSEITIPTYHSSTWYQYLQTYGQPYRVVDRYVNNNGYISSSTRDSVFLEWSGGNPWEGFTFDRIALFLILAFIAIYFFFRKGR